MFPPKVNNFYPLAKSQTITVLSKDPVTTLVPSLLIIAVNTPSVCPIKVLWSYPVLTSQILAVLSRLPVISFESYIPNAILLIEFVCPVKILVMVKVFKL